MVVRIRLYSFLPSLSLSLSLSPSLSLSVCVCVYVCVHVSLTLTHSDAPFHATSQANNINESLELAKQASKMDVTDGHSCTVRVFRHDFVLEDSFGSHACSLEALASV